eukprot:TRINITY_DN867_c0_g1_i1.p1 TRINITY_DN867_c0_g1~~TRINITY_DN867_c0_g1_i1.p1  ORF type:complete len:506 (+),score=117.47 TRINITY_DN867_c0_g1_i1:143-1660(+)
MMTDTVDKTQPLHSTSASGSPSNNGEREGRTRDPDNDPPYSRIFVVCGKASADKDLEAEFQPFGNVQYCKVIRDKKTGESKGIAYIKYDKASAAALAIESVNGKTSANDDQVVYKVMIAEAKTANRSPASVPAKASASKEPEDLPPRSRLFVICPKDYSEEALTQKFAPYGDVEASKIIRDKNTNESKGFAYVKFSKASTAAVALEEVNKNSEKEGEVKLKVLFADPKSKNKTSDVPMPLPFAPMAVPMSFSYGPADLTAYSMPPFIPPRQRLFVVCHKSVTQDQLSRLFSRFPGMEYCDVKKNKQSGESKGFAYINYSTPQAAHMAKEQMDLYDFPAGSPLRVMFAEPLGVNKNSTIPSEPSISAIRDSFAQMMTYPAIAYPPTGHPAVGVSAAHPHPPPIAIAPEPSSTNKTNDRNYPEGSRLFIVLSKALPDYMLQELFSRYGALEYVRLQKDKNYGYAKYTTASSAQLAMSHLNNQEIHGQKITITIAHPPNTDSRKRPRI